MISYDAHREWLKTEVEGMEAEYQGYCAAKAHPDRMLRWSPQSRLQGRFERGYADGKAKLLADQFERDKKGGTDAASSGTI